MYNPDWLRYCKRVIRAGIGADHLLTLDLTLATAHLGSNYGGWVVATEALLAADSPVVLSFGLGDDISFDEEISRSYGCRVYGFDPTPESQKFISLHGAPANMKVFPIGLATTDGKQTFMLPDNECRGNYSAKSDGGTPTVCEVMRYGSILSVLELQRVDVLKLDIEGLEIDVIPDILASSVLPVQLLIEFHHRLYGIDVADTLAAVKLIRQAGYALFAVSPGGQELSFIKV